MRSLIIAAPASGSGKTTVTLGLLRAWRNQGKPIRSAKSGPDYIDPRFHAAASGAECFNLDAWAMSPDRIRSLAAGHVPLLIEGAMGLFDGAPPDGRGAVADLAITVGAPVVLVVDAAHQAQSIAALVAGFAHHRADLTLAGVILNRIGSLRHEKILRQALAPLAIPVLGAIPRQKEIALPSRHLGLVQASEIPQLDAFIEQTSGLVAAHCDLDALWALFDTHPDGDPIKPPPPPAQEIAIAQDQAFAFAYPHLLADWRNSGATLRFFSPLQNAPVPACDLAILPGGYPELYAGQLAAAEIFKTSLGQASAVYGECGGYMVLGQGIVDAQGQRHQMCGFLDLETSFAKRKLTLGYRQLSARHGPFAGDWLGHEFHYATTVSAKGQPLFTAKNAEGDALEPMGLCAGKVSGSFAHVIDRAP